VIEKFENGLLVLKFPNLTPFSDIYHGVFTRLGGVSQHPFHTLNVGCHVGDDEKDVLHNRKILIPHIRDSRLAFLNQIHGDQVLVLDGIKSCEDYADVRTGDAMITRVPKLFLTVQVADCQAILIYDPVRKVVANAHSGWRGSIQNIAGQTIQKMVADFSCDPEDLRAAISPSLGPCCAEFVHYKKELPEKLWKYKDQSDHFDFWSISRDQLITEGLRPENIQISQICTKCHTDRFYSYRSESVTGRFAVLIGLI